MATDTEEYTDSGHESGDENGEVSSEEEGDLFISSTISRDDTQSTMHKEQAMLAKLKDKLTGELPELMPDTSDSLQTANLGPFRPRMLQYPGMPGYMLPPGGIRPGLGRGVHFGPPHFPGPPPPPSMGPMRPLLKANKDAKWRQKLLKKREVLIDSAADDDPDSNKRGPSSQLQDVPEINGVEVEGHDRASRLNDSEHLATSPPMTGTGKRAQTTSLRSDNGEKVISTRRTKKHRVKSKSLVPEKTSQGSKGEKTTQTTDSEMLVEDEKASKESPSNEVGQDDPDQDQSPSSPGLAESLSHIAQRHLGLDILGQSAETLRFNGYLLDTIEMLETQISFLRARDEEINDSVSSSETEEDAETQTPKSQILYRIFCSDEWHHHHNAIFEDEPKIVNDRRDGKLLTGRLRIPNVDTYLNSHPSVCFVIIKEHTCTTGDRRKKRGQSKQTWECLRIVSPTLQRAIEKVAEFSPFIQDPGEDDLKEMDAPYDFLFHHRKQLAFLEIESESYKAALTPLREFLDQNYKTEYQSAEALLKRGRVTSQHLGKLYKPNQIVISQPSNRSPIGAYVLNSTPTREKDRFVFRGWSWQYNGTELQRKTWIDSMDPLPDEEIVITDLSIYPSDFAPQSVLRTLEARGNKFWSMQDRQFFNYSGHNWNQDHVYVDDRFMIDMSTYQKMHHSYNRGGEGSFKFDKWPVTIHKQEVLSNQMKMILPPMTYGFNMQEKKWVLLAVDKIQPVKWNKKAFDRLVLDPKTKEMIYALVDVQTSKDKKMDDIITGKGNGLIILLHGSPGTGKTLTAESVAEIAEKPLYRVTCGDVGTDAEEVEKYLQSVLYLGNIWDCVLLMDEADVFLEERTMADLQRNSLVSVFLRILEYYEGILILTSNRVGTFDEAFKSRIQVAVHYDNLTRRSRKQIWQNFFDMIEEANEDVNMPELENRLDELAAEEMNGRQIRNALLTARQLAKHRKERLGWEHLSQVMKTSAAFNRYLKEVRGHSDEQWAREEMLR
ncbi:hypothetical protein ACHAP5_011918 [Fusarium lateritium]